ncbi:MAG: fibronectin type 3 domain-containing protein, partial [Myxococcota bacterium]
GADNAVSTTFPAGASSFDNLTIGSAVLLDVRDTVSLSVADTITISDGGRLRLSTLVNANNVVVESGGIVTSLSGSTTSHLKVADSMTVESGGKLTADGAGFTSNQGPGAGQAYNTYIGGAGGGYGCAGGNGGGYSGTTVGGTAYGDAANPVDAGSAGGSGCAQAPGGSGGGLIRATVLGVLTIDGTVSANANNGKTYSSTCSSGGGAGGTVVLAAGTLAGAGTISANGGSTSKAYYAHGGGGGGGRIAIQASIDDFSGPILTNGGVGYVNGCIGSIHRVALTGQVVDLAGLTGTGTGDVDLSWSTPSTPNPLLESFDLRTATVPITDATWAAATSVTPAPPTLGSEGVVHNLTVTGLTGGQTHYFAMRILDADGAAGVLSNLASAAAGGDEVAPEAITDLAAVGGGSAGTVLLTWTAPSDTAGTVTGYELRFASTAGTFDWDLATQLTTSIPTPGASGTAESMVTAEIPTGDSVHVAIRSTDGANVSATSNLALADLTPPSVAITSPLDGAEITKTILVTATTTDDVGVARVELLIDGSVNSTDTTPGDGVAFDLDTRTLSVGAHSLTATAYDDFGNTATSVAVSVTVAYAAPTKPIITSPFDGLATSSNVHDVAGTADPGTSVALSVNGAVAQTVTASGLSTTRVEAEAAINERGSCSLTASGDALTLVSGNAFTNVALYKPVTVTSFHSANYTGDNATDGAIEDGVNAGTYWLTSPGAKGSQLTVDLEKQYEINQIRIINTRNGPGYNYSTGAFRIFISADGSTYTQIHAGALVDDDIVNWYSIVPPAGSQVRYVRFIEDTYFGNGGGLAEIQVYGSLGTSACMVTTPWVDLSQAGTPLAVTVDGSEGGGTITHEVAFDEPLASDDFAGTFIDPVLWDISTRVVQNDGLKLTGITSWGTTYAQTRTVYETATVESVQFTVQGIAGHTMVGVKRPTASKSYTQYAHAFYFAYGALHIYEDAGNKGNVGSYSYNTDYDVRIEFTRAGSARYYFRVHGASSWSLIYTSSVQTGAQFHAGVVTYDGDFTVSAFSLKGERWHPATELAQRSTGRMRFRSTLSRPSAAAISPILDAILVESAASASGAQAGVFRFPGVLLPEGDVTLSVDSTDSTGTSTTSDTNAVHVDSVAPAAISDLGLARGPEQGDVVLTWSAVGDDGGVGIATAYEVRYSTVEHTADNWALATVWTTNIPIPSATGTAETITLTGLAPGQLYHVSVRVLDELGNASGISNIESEKARDKTNPILSFTAPADLTHHNNTATITATATDNVAVTAVNLYIDDALVATDVTSPYSLSWDTTAFTDAAHAVKVEAVDDDANKTAITRTLTGDNTVPTISIVPPTTPTAAVVTLAVTIADNLTPESELVTVDDLGGLPPFAYDNELIHARTLTVTDKAGNFAQATATFTLDKSAPTQITDLAAASSDLTAATLTWTAPSDSLTDVASYEVRRSTSLSATAGTGSDGDLLVSGATVFAPAVTNLTASVSAGDATLTVTDATNFAVGDEVVLYAPQCLLANAHQAGESTWNSGGGRRISTISGNELGLDSGVPIDFDAVNCTVVVQRVPNYDNVRVFSGGTLSPAAWDGSVGGLIAMRVKGALNVDTDGKLVADGAGYRGTNDDCVRRADGLHGESYVTEVASRGRLARFTGGGGGQGDRVGQTIRQAAGGGGGGHGSAGTKGADYSTHVGGEGGGVIGDAQFTQFYYGGGGGQGGADDDGGSPGGGGAGGGAILIAGTKIVISGRIGANGKLGRKACNGCSSCGGVGCGMGGGGGGAGGAVHLVAAEIIVTSGSVTANGGTGGSHNGCGGTGSAGGIGRVRMDTQNLSGASSPVAHSGGYEAFDWASATPITVGVPTPASAGSAETMNVTGLDAGTSYYFGIRSTNAVGRTSLTSNIAIRDIEDPSVTITSPSDGATLTRPVIAQATPLDDIGVVSVEWLVDGTSQATDSNPPFTFDFDTRQFADGAHTLTAVARDAGGRSGSDSIDVTIAGAAPGAPEITWPAHGYLTTGTLTGVAGVAEAGTTVDLYVNGALHGSVVTQVAPTVNVEAEASPAQPGCEITATGVVISDTPLEATVNLALASAGAVITGGSRPTHGNDGIANTSNYWYRSAAKNEVLYYVGRLKLAKAELLGEIRMRLWDGDTRAYYNYKVTVSADGQDFETWVDRTGSGENYKSWQNLKESPRLVRYIDVYLSGSTVNVGAHIIELEAYRSEEPLVCKWTSSDVAVLDGARLGNFIPTHDVGGGTIDYSFQVAGDSFADHFNTLDTSKWTTSRTTHNTDGTVTINGVNSWGSGHLTSVETFERGTTTWIQTRVKRDGGGNGMFGLRRTSGSGYSYSQLGHSMYLTSGGIQIYEDAAYRGQHGTFPYGAFVDLRIEVLPVVGVRYWYKLASSEVWKLAYTSSYNGGNSWNISWSLYSGLHHVDQITARSTRWVDMSEFSKLSDIHGAIRLRALMQRDSASTTSPFIDKMSFQYITAGAATAGDAMFEFSDVPLVEGGNDIFAYARDADGTSPVSETVTVLVDTGPPNAVTDLSVKPLGAGVLFLSWSPPLGEIPASYTIYRSTSAITDITALQALASNVTETSFGDKPGADGVYHYVITSTDVAGNVSTVSNDAFATADSNTPHAAIALSPVSPVGPGTVSVTVTPSEPLSAVVLTATFSDGTVLDITTAAGSGDTWVGSFGVLSTHAAGTATFAFTGTDVAGNPGSIIDSGGSFTVDTEGPTGAVTIDPVSPAIGGLIAIELYLNEPATSATLTLTPEGKTAVDVSIEGFDLLLTNGSLWTDTWHLMADGTLHTGSEHTAGAQLLTVSTATSHRRWRTTFTVTSTTGDGLATFGLQATDLAGNTGNTITAGETFTIDANAPGAPTDLVAAKQPAGYFVITWTAPTGDDPADLTYRVYLATVPFTDTAIASLVASPTDTTLQNQPPEAGTWFYGVTAVDASGNEGPLSASAQAVADPPPPEDVTDLANISSTDTSVTVSWTASANSFGILAGYRVYLDGALLASTDGTTVGHTIDNLTASTGYTVKVSAFDANNKESIGVSTPAYTLLPNPSGVVALGLDKRVELSFASISDETTLLHYAIYLSEAAFSSTAGMTPVAFSVGGSSTTLGGLTNGTNYHLAVVSVNKVGLSNPVVGSVGATPGDEEAPEAPESLIVLTATATTMDVVWTASANSAGDLANYKLYKDGTLLATLGSGVTTHQLTGLSAATAYTLEVSSLDFLGNESAKVSKVGYTLLANPLTVVLAPHDKSIGVTWTASSPSANVDHYNLYVLPADFVSVDGLAASKTATGTSASLTGLTNGTKYFVAVTAVNKSGVEFKDVVTVNAVPVDDAPPAAPSSVTVTNVGDDTVDFTWTASSNTSGDLAGYKIYVDDVLITTLASSALAHQLTGLNEATKLRIGVTAFDSSGNESGQRVRAAYTLMGHPGDLTVSEQEHERLTVTWTAPAPVGNVSYYKVYVSPNAFSNVNGLLHKQTAGASATSAIITGLQNGTDYFIAVTTVNRSGGERLAVTTVTGKPTLDGVGPTLGGLTHNGAGFVDNSIVAVDGTFAATATDPSGVKLVRFSVDGAQIGLDQSASGGFNTAWSLNGVTDGAHVLTVDAEDIHGNVTTLTVNFVVQLAAPVAPSITSPANNAATNQAQLLVKGAGKPGTTARVYVNNVVNPATTLIDPSGHFSVLVTLAAGSNTLEATAENGGGESLRSTARTVVYDNTTPKPPKSLTATPREGGVIRIVWFDQGDNSLSGIAERRVYRHTAPFTDVSEATSITPGNLNADLLHNDLPASDAVWFYGATVVNKAGTESVLSNIASATSDGTAPKALSIEYTPGGAFIDPRFGVGPVTVKVTFSEALGTSPFLSLTPDGGLPIPISLTEQSPTVYTGAFEITEFTKTATAYAVLSARDSVNNRGTSIDVGGSIEIDTDAPNVAALTIAPASPILNDPDSPATITVTLLLNEELPTGVSPELKYVLDSSHQTATDVVVARIAEKTWRGGFILPDDAGVSPEGLLFSYLGIDDLGNESEKIDGSSSAEVYQGTLPALVAPLALTATSKPGGIIALTWSSVAGAAEYQVYRRGPTESELTALIRTTETTLDDATPADGSYQYSVATVRSQNGQESLSALAPAVSALADSIAQAAPGNLVATLVGNGIKLDWTEPPGLSELIQFAIYRAGGTEITSTTGLTPIGAGIEQLFAVDPFPSLTDHAYVVVAKDAVGNESPVSNTAYLNPGLLPVSTISVRHVLPNSPVLSWTHPTASLGGFKLTADGVDPTGSLVTESSYIDADFVGTLRLYGVTAVDPQGTESVERTLSLPVISVAKGSPFLIERGVINTVNFVVKADADVPGATLVVRVNNKNHPSATLTLAAGVATDVSVVIGGYPALADTVLSTITVKQTPNPGEKIEVVSSLGIPAGDNIYGIDVLNGTFTRGATGSARLTFHNTSAQEVEIITGKGNSPSTQVRYVLSDTDGNVLATTPMKQATGEGVVTLSSGFSVARIPAGESWTSAVTSVPVPIGAPDIVVLKAVIDKVHYHVGKPDHVEIPGINSTVEFSLVDAAYYAEVTGVTPASSFGDENIVLTGHARQTGTDVALADVKVRLRIAVAGFERKFDLFTDADGNFSYTFVPLANEGGVYTAWATHPSVSNKTAQATFKIHRVSYFPASATLQLATNYAHTVPARLTTNVGTTLTNARIVPGTLPTGITLALPTPADVASASTHQLPFTVTGDNTAPAQTNFKVSVVSDEGTWGTITVHYTLTSAEPALGVKPAGFETGVGRGESQTETLTFTNKGLAKFSNLQLTLLNSAKTGPAPSWVFLASASTISTLEVGASTQTS